MGTAGGRTPATEQSPPLVPRSLPHLTVGSKPGNPIFYVAHIDGTYNVAPTKKAPVVIARAADDMGDEDPVRELGLFRWGLLPN